VWWYYCLPQGGTRLIWWNWPLPSNLAWWLVLPRSTW
jgi:hypothetical protein